MIRSSTHDVLPAPITEIVSELQDIFEYLLIFLERIADTSKECYFFFFVFVDGKAQIAEEFLPERSQQSSNRKKSLGTYLKIRKNMFKKMRERQERKFD